MSDPALGLRDEFSPPTGDDWRARVSRDLEGRSADQLDWHTDAGFALPPWIPPAENTEFAHQPVLAAMLAARPTSRWQLRERVACADPQDAARALGRAAARDADELELCIGATGVRIGTADDLARALHDVDLAAQPVCLSGGTADAAAWYLELADTRGVERAQLRGELELDAIETDIAPGTSLRTVICSNAALEARHAPDHLQLAGVLTDAAEALRGPAATIDRLALRFTVGARLWSEVAKLRVARVLWAKLAAAFGAPPQTSAHVPITAVVGGSQRATARDFYTNLLRHSLGATAATLGCADAIAIATHDPRPAGQSVLGRDLARDQQHLLRHECFLDRVTDPVAGSRTLECLTDRLARATWTAVSEIETRGGRRSAEAKLWLDGQIARHTPEESLLVGVTKWVDAELEMPPGEEAGP